MEMMDFLDPYIEQSRLDAAFHGRRSAGMFLQKK